MKVIKPFRGVREGDIYPTEMQPGEDCPPELEGAGIELGCVELAEGEGEKPGRKAKGVAPENK